MKIRVLLWNRADGNPHKAFLGKELLDFCIFMNIETRVSKQMEDQQWNRTSRCQKISRFELYKVLDWAGRFKIKLLSEVWHSAKLANHWVNPDTKFEIISAVELTNQCQLN